jgi:hypothetical protein
MHASGNINMDPSSIAIPAIHPSIRHRTHTRTTCSTTRAVHQKLVNARTGALFPEQDMIC